MIRPDFAGSNRDYSEPAERVDTGDYAVDRFPSDADVGHRDGGGDDSDIGSDTDNGSDTGRDANDADGASADSNDDSGRAEGSR